MPGWVLAAIVGAGLGVWIGFGDAPIAFGALGAAGGVGVYFGYNWWAERR